MKAMNRRANRARTSLLAICGLLLLVIGCADTDREMYASGDPGTTNFTMKIGRMPVWLGGCNVFVQQQWDGVQWIDRGGELACFWEGFAQPVAPRETLTSSFTARDPGTWRLAYEVGIGCQPDQPLNRGNCEGLTSVVSNTFTVLDPDDDEGFCTATGGDWNVAYCGDLYCGQPNACLALIPGCDCGPDANFERAVGCVEDPACSGGGSDAQALCEDTGGVWDPTSCGHYSCGNAPSCDAIIPGCNCGSFSVFDEAAGCLAAPCGAPRGSTTKGSFLRYRAS